jgi:hypothetical protein
LKNSKNFSRGLVIESDFKASKAVGYGKNESSVMFCDVPPPSKEYLIDSDKRRE